MSIVKISDLPIADSPVSPSDVLPVVQNGVTKKAGIDSLGYIMGSSSAVPRSIQSKLRERVSVLDFGASPSASAATNGAAFEAALTYIQDSYKPGTAGPGSAGGILYVPAGNYNIDRSLEIGYGVTMQGDGVYASILIFNGSISGSGSYCVSVGPSTIPGYTFGYTFGTELRDIGISAGGTEDYVVLVPGMHQHSLIENVNIRAVRNVGLQLNGTGGPAYNVVKRVSVGSSPSPLPTAAGIVCNSSAANVYFEAISVEAEYGQSFAIGVDVIATNVNFNTIHFAYCTKGIRLKAFPQGLYASNASAYIRFAHDDAGGPSTDLIYVESGYAGGFVIEGTYSYAVPIGTLGCKILNNQITGQSIPSSRTVNYYRYPEWTTAYSEAQTVDPTENTYTPPFTSDVSNVGAELTRVNMSFKQLGVEKGIITTGYGGSGFTISCLDSLSLWPAGCRYIGDSSAFIATTAGVDLGSGTYRWDTLFATNGTIDTSDANQKQQIQDLSAAEKAVALEIKAKVKRFKFNTAVAEKGDSARIHVGVIAQDVKAAFEAHGLDPDQYALFCRDTWYEVDGKKFDELTGKDYTSDSAGAVAVTQLGIRYSELLAFIISAI